VPHCLTDFYVGLSLLATIFSSSFHVIFLRETIQIKIFVVSSDNENTFYFSDNTKRFFITALFSFAGSVREIR
jgi:hypothetical protein